MAANPHDDKQVARKRSRETSAMETSDVKEPSEKRLKEESTAIPNVEISCYTYFSLSGQEVINEDQLKIWGNFIRVIRKFLFPTDIDGSTPNVIRVPQKILTILQKMKYNRISPRELSIILEERQSQLTKILSQLKRFKGKPEEREPLFTQLKQFIQEGVLNLTLVESSGWNILHGTIFFYRVDVLICIQQYLLPELLGQYEKLLCTKTKKTQATPISMMEARHEALYYEEMSSLLNEKSLPGLKEKHLDVILKILVSHEEKLQDASLYEQLQCASLYEQLKQLVAEGVDPTMTEDTKGFTILHYAVDSYDMDLIKYISQHISLKQCQELLSAKTKDVNLTPISMAEKYNYENIRLLLEKKKDLIEIFTELKRLREMKKADRQLLYNKIKQFIKTGGNLTDDKGLNILHYAACFVDTDLVLFIKECAKPEQYKELLCAKSKKKGLTPYGVVLEYKKKSSENEKLLKLLNPEADQNISQSSEQLGGQSAFFKPAPSGDSSLNKTTSSTTNQSSAISSSSSSSGYRKSH